MVKLVIAIFIAVFGVGAILWAANWPFGTPLAGELSEAQRGVEAAHNRRHHFIVFMSSLVIVAVSLGTLATVEFAEPDGDWATGVVMAVVSLSSLGVFVAVVRRRRRRRRTR